MSNEPIELGKRLIEYCEKFFIPLEYVFEILDDQKVVPMIRGKATEYNGYMAVTDNLSPREWAVQKLNLNAQPGTDDEDISITHKRSGLILKAECKNAVRGSMKSGARARVCNVPHFHVKCHRSRSNIRLAGTSNDRYSIDTFDVILCNVSNALFQGRTVGAELEVLHEKNVIIMVQAYYGVSTDSELIERAYHDWRFAFPEEIGEGGFIPRTPVVRLDNDPHWRPLQHLDAELTKLVKKRAGEKGSSRKGSRR